MRNDYVIIVYGINVNGGARSDLHVLRASGDAPSTTDSAVVFVGLG